MLEKIPFKIKLFLVFAASIFGGYLAITLAGSFGGGAPRAFSEARMQGAIIAQSIVDASNQSAAGLQKINDLDRKGDFTQALNEVTTLVGKSQEIRDQAVKLSAELEKMTKALSAVESPAAREAALEAIGNHLSLITRLVNYSTYLGRLLEVLRNRFLGKFSDTERVADLINQINEEVKSVNSLNLEAREAIDRFDQLVR